MSEDYASIDKAQLISMIHFLEKRQETSKKEKLELKERYRLRLCEADMKLDVGLPQQSNYYGERCRFLHGYQKACDH